jgi:hypothetical protein
VNISSPALDQQEVTTIANELKQQLAKPDDAQAKGPDGNDIFIDQDGTLHLRK